MGLASETYPHDAWWPVELKGDFVRNDTIDVLLAILVKASISGKWAGGEDEVGRRSVTAGNVIKDVAVAAAARLGSGNCMYGMGGDKDMSVEQRLAELTKVVRTLDHDYPVQASTSLRQIYMAGRSVWTKQVHDLKLKRLIVEDPDSSWVDVSLMSRHQILVMASDTLSDCEALFPFVRYGLDVDSPRSTPVELGYAMEHDGLRVIVHIEPIPAAVMNALSAKHSAAVYAMRELAGLEHALRGASPEHSEFESIVQLYTSAGATGWASDANWAQRTDHSKRADTLAPQPENPVYRVAIVEYPRPELMSKNGMRYDSTPLANAIIKRGVGCDVVRYTGWESPEALTEFINTCRRQYDGFLLRLDLRQLDVGTPKGTRGRFEDCMNMLSQKYGKVVWPRPDVFKTMTPRLAPCKAVACVFEAVLSNKAHHGVVPLEEGDEIIHFVLQGD